MEQKDIAVGLDIGTTKIVAMIGKKNEYGKVEIVGIGKSRSLGVHRGVVNNITQTIQSIQQAIQEAEADSGQKIKDVVVGITASSSTPYVLGALEKSKEVNAMTGLIICNEPIELSYVDHMIPLIVGPEVITGSTRMKAGTATKMVLNMITTTSMIKLNKTYGNLMVDLKASNQKLWDRGSRIISHITDLDYDESFELLKIAHGEVKSAIVMNKLNMNIKEAQSQLREEQGSLRNILDNPESV